MSNTFTETVQNWAELSMRRSMREFTQFMREKGISMPQIAVLMKLKHHGPCQISDIGEHLEITKPAASQMVQRLVEQGVLTREEDPLDRRVKKISVTDKGNELVIAAVAARRSWIQRLSDRLTDQEQEIIEDALELLIEASTRMEVIVG